MTPCPAPSGLLLPADHRPFFDGVLRTLADNEYLPEKLNPLLPQLIEKFPQFDTTLDAPLAWTKELGLWVRWYRLPAYWLTYIFQLTMAARRSFFQFSALDLYSDAQSNFADDLALSSLETAHTGYVRNRARLVDLFTEPGAEFIGASIREKLRYYHAYYYRLSQHFDYRRASPCADHIYWAISKAVLTFNVRENNGKFDVDDAAALEDVIAQSGSSDFVYHRILARRFLGHIQARQKKFDLAAEQFQQALGEAQRVGLDTEVGHLHRLCAVVLRSLGQLDAACHQFEQAIAHEQHGQLFPYTGYWQALSARELGNTILRQAGRRVERDDVALRKPGTSESFYDDLDQAPLRRPGTDVFFYDDLERLRPALNAFRVGRIMLNSHMTLHSPFPIGRAAKQQLFRIFNLNAMQAAYLLKSTEDMLAEVEFTGPREATEVVTAIAAARGMKDASLPDFRRNRAIYYRTLNTMPSRFEDYTQNLEQLDAERRAYLKQTLKLTGNVLHPQLSDDIVERMLNLRIPDTVFLLFHLAEETGIAIAVDMSTGVGTTAPVALGESQVRAIGEEYQRTATDPVTRRQALDIMLGRYSDIFGQVFEALLPMIRRKHLKIFPRLQMNSVPLHALRIEGKYLINHVAAISYGQTLGLFLENHIGTARTYDLPLRVVIGKEVPWYEVLMPQIRPVYQRALDEMHDPSWQTLVEAISSRPAADTLFACHGKYDADDLEASYLDLAGSEGGLVAFSRVFAELDLDGCRSVIMGACESGLVRAEIGAEYVGLPSAMLSSGVRYVIGALWRIPQLATAILVGRYLELVRRPSVNVCAGLCQAQRALMAVTRDELYAWVRAAIEPGPDRDDVLREVDRLDHEPYAHPYFWAGLQVVGDV